MTDEELDDFTNLEGLGQTGMTAYRYALAFMTYFMAVEQYYKLPACPEIIQPRMDRLKRGLFPLMVLKRAVSAAQMKQ